MAARMASSSSLIGAAEAWLSKDPDASTRQQLQDLLNRNDHDALEQAFGARLEFGTAGLRGLMGIGPNNMNRLVVQQTTAGLAEYLREAQLEPGNRQRVVVAYDGRHGSRTFAHDAAGVLAAKDIDVLLYETTAPTPLCAFAVKHLKTAAGIVITASHNPPKYNGYKVYRYGGTQINDPVDGQISEKIAAVAGGSTAPECMPFKEARASGIISMLGQDMFARYVSAVIEAVPPMSSTSGDDHGDAQMQSQQKRRADFAIAYTPLHGVGAPIAEQLFARLGFTRVHTVAEQREPDGDFPTVDFPNPEEKGATDLLIALANKHNAPIAIANDPDADRLCICARDSAGSMRQMTGDQLGSLLGDALMRHAIDVDGEVPSSLAVRCTIVSSRILARLAKSYGVEHRETLTGFKWLGPSAQRVAQNGRRFVFAYEEALGYMATDVVLDKDGLSGLVAISNLAFALHCHGKTLWDQLEDIHRRVGLSITMQRTIKLQPGMSGDAIMKRLRKEKCKEVGGYPIAFTDDLNERPPLSAASPDEIPRNDVLRYFIGTSEDKSDSVDEVKLSQPRIIVRPSGTEPKVKIYCELLSEIGLDEGYEQATSRATAQLTDIVDAFHSWMSRPESSLDSAAAPDSSSSQSHPNAPPISWTRKLFRAFPFVTTDPNPVLSPLLEQAPSKPILYVAPAHPRKMPNSSAKWSSRDPTCLYWQTQLVLRQIEFDVVHIEEDYSSSGYQGEGFSRVPILLDVDRTVVGRNDLNRWADSVAPWPEKSRTLAQSSHVKTFESLLRGPLQAGVLLEVFLLPAPQQDGFDGKPLFVRQLLRSIAAERKRDLACQISALTQYSPTSSIPGWVTSLHGLIGNGSASLTGTGNLGPSAEDEEADAQARSVDISKLDHAAIRREACQAIDAIATLKEDGKGWLMGDEAIALDALLFSQLHTLLSLPVLEGAAEKTNTFDTLSLRRHLDTSAPHLVTWTRNMWRNVAKPRGG